MMNDQLDTVTKLLCTFVSKSRLVSVVNRINEHFEIDRGRIFVLKDKTFDKFKYILTYNIVISKSNDKYSFHKDIPNTIPINRKKDLNCLYTLDALNEIIFNETGSYEKGTEVDWSPYRNCLLTTKDNELIVTHTEIESIQILDYYNN